MGDVQQELRESFNKKELQEQISDLEEKYENELGLKWYNMKCPMQKYTPPQYGFKADLNGMADMRHAIQPFKDDPGVSENIDVINRLVGKKKCDIEQMAAFEKPPVIAPIVKRQPDASSDFSHLLQQRNEIAQQV